jgi:hypothetical protein
MIRPTDAVRSLRGHEALAALAEFLENLKPELYKHSAWWERGFRNFEENINTDCGTAACAGGWSVTLFDGLTAKADEDGMYEPAYKGETAIYALGRFFDIPTDDATGIFGCMPIGNMASTNHQVAARIREVLARATR